MMIPRDPLMLQRQLAGLAALGKGRKTRCTPLRRDVAAALDLASAGIEQPECAVQPQAASMTTTALDIGKLAWGRSSAGGLAVGTERWLGACALNAESASQPVRRWV